MNEMADRLIEYTACTRSHLMKLGTSGFNSWFKLIFINCAIKNGFSSKEIANFLNFSEATINRYKTKHFDLLYNTEYLAQTKAIEGFLLWSI